MDVWRMLKVPRLNGDQEVIKSRLSRLTQERLSRVGSVDMADLRMTCEMLFGKDTWDAEDGVPVDL